ncbi:hypothetical protein K1719_007070 [Acacia pycnantha]|nr:hypothetical protein K1719_007070 [Acacia pycnantha]
MRIRKSQLLFPFSSLSPVPPSDPHLINPSPVVQLHDDIPLPPDQPHPPIGKSTDLSGDSSGVAAVSAGSGAHRLPQKQYGLEEDGVRGRGEEGEKGNDTRKGSISGSQTVADHVLSPSSPSNQDERWCEGEKAIPLKKRRGSFERIKAEEEYDEVTKNNNKKEKTRMKTKMNKTMSRQKVDEQGGERETERERKGGRKRARGSAVTEGSRCSRVNGRGWRCCQQTLVGYSLCEHHLGKGRLRSITSVKNPYLPPTKPDDLQLLSQLSTSSSSHVIKQMSGVQQDHEEEDKKPETYVGKKRMKLGVVKARSISSLLGQTNTHVAIPDNNR